MIYLPTFGWFLIMANVGKYTNRPMDLIKKIFPKIGVLTGEEYHGIESVKKNTNLGKLL